MSESLGMPVDKLNLVVVWREAPLFSARERAALAWTEALTLLPDGVSDEVYAQASAEFSEKELAYLTSAVASINVWNRFGAAYRWTPPARPKKQACAGRARRYADSVRCRRSFARSWAASTSCGSAWATAAAVTGSVPISRPRPRISRS